MPIRIVHKTEADQARAAEEHQKSIDRLSMEMLYGPASPVHKNLKRFRVSNNLKKQEMAEYMEVTPRTYYAYEEGLRAIPSDALVKLATMTRADLNELLMGQPASTEFQTIRSALIDMALIMKKLEADYPDMGHDTRNKIAHHCITTDWEGSSRLHPEIIRTAVSYITRYRYEPYEIPSPPDCRSYESSDLDQYDRDVSMWQSIVDEEVSKQKMDRES